MIDQKSDPGPSDVRGISDPPDMGRMRPAEDVAKETLATFRAQFWPAAAEKMERDLANLIRHSRSEGAAAALEEMAEAFDAEVDEAASASSSLAWQMAAKALRASAKGISDPPDPG